MMGAQHNNVNELNYDPKSFDWEGPVHSVTLDSYYIAETLVTQALWQAVMGSTPIPEIKAAGIVFRIPTEAEWEFACRGGLSTKGLRFSGSDKVDDVAWFDYNSNGQVHPIKEKQPNELGLYDMSGNLFEWCYDWYTRYSGESLVNPQGPATALRRVLRGGCWNYSSRNCRCSYRLNDSPHHADSYYGLRLAMSVVK